MNLEADILSSKDPAIYNLNSKAKGPEGSLPLTDKLLKESPSGDLFGLSQNVGMGWKADEVGRKQVLILSTQGGLRAEDGKPIALGFHTGHWEIALQVKAAAETLKELGYLPFAGQVSDPCDGRSQGTTGMFDSLPYRNDAAIVLRRLARSLPQRVGVIGIATCDKGLPAMLMAVAGLPDLPAVIVPGGVTLPPKDGEDAGKIQTIGVRYAHGLISLQEAADLGCRACATPGGGCQFLGTAATAQVVAEALGLAPIHSALAPSGQGVWLDNAKRAAQFLTKLTEKGISTRKILTQESLRNAMVVHAAFGGSTNLLLHIPAIAHAAKLKRPTVSDWIEINQAVPRLVDALPNGPKNHPTVQVFLAGGVPEVMLHLRNLNLLNLEALTVSSFTLGQQLELWENSERRAKFKSLLLSLDNVQAEHVILTPEQAKVNGLTSTVSFVRGNLAPDGAIVKSTSIDASVVDADGTYRLEGPAKVFVKEDQAVQAIKEGKIEAGDVLVLAGCGPLGTGMEETYQITSALKFLPFGKQVALITDARFSGVSTGACIGHVGPEALAGGSIGKLKEGDRIKITIDRHKLQGTLDFVGENGKSFSAEQGAKILEARKMRADICAHSKLPEDTKLWALLQKISGGTWGGCVYDLEAIEKALGG